MLERTEILSRCKFWSPDNRSRNLCAEPFQPLIGKTKLYFRDYVDWGLKLMVPRSNLFGRQMQEEYTAKKTKIVEARLELCGQRCLKENPVAACWVPLKENESLICNFDGHHRARYSGKFKEANEIDAIPTIVYTPEVLFYIVEKHGVEMGSSVPRDPEDLIGRLRAQIIFARESFREAKKDKDGEPIGKPMPRDKEPVSVKAGTIDELINKFPPFTIPSEEAIIQQEVLRERVLAGVL